MQAKLDVCANHLLHRKLEATLFYLSFDDIDGKVECLVVKSRLQIAWERSRLKCWHG